MFYTKLALVTCAFYLCFAVLLDAMMLGMTMWKGASGIYATKTAWLMFFGTAWLVSFLLSWRIVVVPIFARIHKS